MTIHIALGIGAGLVAAILFAAIGARSMPAVLLMYLAPLPILIVSLGWHHLLGLLALSAGALALSTGGLAMSPALRPSVGLAFALGPALSAWFLAYLSLLVRPASDDDGDRSERWYPTGYLLFWLGVAGALIGVSSLFAATGGDYERYRSALEEAAAALLRPGSGLVRDGPSPEAMGARAREIARAIVDLAPALLGSMLTLILTLNLWLAAKVVFVSGRLSRPWPDVPATRMPVTVVFALVAAFLVSWMDGFTGVVGMALTGSLTMAFFLQGLALMHYATRGRTGRGAILAIVYGLMLIIGYLLVPAFALLGIVDSSLPIRRAVTPPSN